MEDTYLIHEQLYLESKSRLTSSLSRLFTQLHLFLDRSFCFHHPICFLPIYQPPIFLPLSSLDAMIHHFKQTFANT